MQESLIGEIEKYHEVVRALESRPVMPDRPLSLHATAQGLERIGYYDSPFFKKYLSDPKRVLIVAGTNGKGSVCATLETLLCEQGERVGLYTSPHLIETTERIRVNRRDIAPGAFIKVYESVEPLTRDLQLTHFEMLTLMAIWYFACSGSFDLDRIILEVGLGGLWDATNAIPHGFCILTKLGHDHENILGRGLKNIGKNKFAVIPEKSAQLPDGATVIHFPVPPEIAALAQEFQIKTGSKWFESKTFPLKVKKKGKAIPSFVLQTPWGDAALALPGVRGAENTSLALLAFEKLGYDPSKCLASLANVDWPGRMDAYTYQGRTIFLSGDHNPQGAESLKELLTYYEYDEVFFLVGIGKDKDARGILEILSHIPRSHIYLTETPFRGKKLDDYGAWALRAMAQDADPKEAFRDMLQKARAGDICVVTGSLYLVGEIRKLLIEK